MHNTPITVCWKKEASCLAMLAPSRRDLMLRLVRNALPLGIKRIHWETDAQKMCMLCELDCVESADHLFWRCQFAKDTWAALLRPWRNHRNGTVSWAEVLKDYEVRLDGVNNKTVEQLWAIIRACVIRVIWFERNRRYFYASLPNRSPAFRLNQGIDDIRAHIDAGAAECPTPQRHTSRTPCSPSQGSPRIITLLHRITTMAGTWPMYPRCHS